MVADKEKRNQKYTCHENYKYFAEGFGAQDGK